MLGSPRYQNIAGSTAGQDAEGVANPRRSSTRLPAAALSQNNSGTTAEPATASVACMRPRMVNSASARMRSIPPAFDCPISTAVAVGVKQGQVAGALDRRAS